jgi:hypothetical protein
MPRTCLACSSPERAAIDKALLAGEPLRNIAERVSISTPALFRHKPHVAQAVVKAVERDEEKKGLDLVGEAERIRHKAWELLRKLEAEGDHRGSVVALREVRECLDTLGNLLSNADDGGLSNVPDDAILHEAKRRGLKMPVNIRVVYDVVEPRNPIDLQEPDAPGST